MTSTLPSVYGTGARAATPWSLAAAGFDGTIVPPTVASKPRATARVTIRMAANMIGRSCHPG